MDNKVVKISIVLGIIVFLIGGISFILIMPKLELDKEYIEVEVYDEFKGVGYKAKQLGNDLTDLVKIKGEVDTSHLGEYKINYELENNLFKTNKELTVKVVDRIKPSISLVGGNSYNVCSRESCEEVGYTALDNYDGDITDKVERIINDDNIEYKVSDSSGNTESIKRELIIKDDEAPVLTLNGNAEVWIYKDSLYNEAGFKAEDNCDGVITDKVEVIGNVDSSTIGVYELKYIIKDHAGNETFKIRKVNVIENSAKNIETDYDGAPSSGGIIYLTFDDGPGSHTSRILDTLAKYNIKATFFVTLGGSDEMIAREAREGHTVALHTATHAWSIYNSVDAYFDDLNRVSERVKNITGIESKYIRFPGGSSNTVSKGHSKGIMTTLTKEVETRGYKYFDWNVDVNDAGTCAGSKVSDRPACVLNYFKKGLKSSGSNVVLMHDVKSYTADALDSMISYALGKGYIFKAIDDTTPTCHHRVNN